jgi:hypothetical protein
MFDVVEFHHARNPETGRQISLGGDRCRTVMLIGLPRWAVTAPKSVSDLPTYDNDWPKAWIARYHGNADAAAVAWVWCVRMLAAAGRRRELAKIVSRRRP